MRTTGVIALALGVGCAAALAQDAPAPPTPEQRRAQFDARFAQLDADKDGTLRGDELRETGWLERFDRDGDDGVTRDELHDVLARGPGYDRLFVLRDVRPRVALVFASFDADKDGRVAAEEYGGGKRAFRGADRNRDGFLDGPEVRRLAESELEDIRRRARNPGRYEMLALFDLDYDRRVVLAEYDGPTRAFQRLDENDDGVVDYYEVFPQFRMRDRVPEAPRAEDLNALKTLDTDGDGKVARAEWKGSAAAWRRLDRNGDGWLTVADAR